LRDSMPKAKPTQVITHRIEMGAWERENIGKPISETAQSASILSSVGVAAFGTASVFAAYALWKFWGVFEFASEKIRSGVDFADSYTSGDASLTNPATPQPVRIIRGFRRLFSI